MGKKLELYGVHWYSEGDVKFVVHAINIREACNQFLAAEQKLIQEVEDDKVLTHTVTYHRNNTADLIIRVGDLYEVRGFVAAVKYQIKPIYLENLVKTSIKRGAVTSEGRLEAVHLVPLILQDQ